MISFCKKLSIISILFNLSFSLLSAQGQADSTWPMFRHDLNHIGLSPLVGDMDTCYLLWSYTAGERPSPFYKELGKP